jgi:cell wall-associated NlpC family hydrolase
VAADEAATPAGGATPPSTYDTVDAIWAAARLLCSNGAASTSGLAHAIFAYNHSDSYVATVEALAATYSGSGSATATALGAVKASLSQLGVPYVWGGETPGQAFDCSGLVQWAYRTAGIDIPRTTQTQWAELRHLSATSPLEPGDLLYYGPANAPTHVGMYLGNGRMIDAPYSGVDVRIDSVDIGENYVGAIRPSDLRAPASH